MTSTAKNLKSLYDAIEALPVGVTGELVNGQWSMVNGQWTTLRAPATFSAA